MIFFNVLDLGFSIVLAQNVFRKLLWEFSSKSFGNFLQSTTIKVVLDKK